MAKCNGMPEQKFRSIAKKAVADYWNENQTLSKKFGKITDKKVYVVWQCKAIQNFKALLGVNFEGDGMYFEFTLNGDANEGYLDVYKKQKHVTVTL
ncbi:MAG: hypothetical protein IKG04_00605 [Exiguobacterium sp.]|nr:hypothetical protein [Exiguobacterium sp.]